MKAAGVEFNSSALASWTMTNVNASDIERLVTESINDGYRTLSLHQLGKYRWCILVGDPGEDILFFVVNAW